MSVERVGKLLLDNGHFEVFWTRKKHPDPDKSYAPTYTVRYRLMSDGRNIFEIRDLEAQMGFGRSWESRKGLCGWSVASALECQTLCERLNRKSAAGHPRMPVVQAWERAVRLIPTFARADAYAKGKRYFSKDQLHLREAIQREVALETLKHPPENRILGSDFFDHWPPPLDS